MATLVVTHPGWLAAALLLACACATAARAARLGRRGPELLWPTGLAVATCGIVGGLLAACGGSGARVVLAILAVCGGLWLIVEMYRRESRILTRFRRVLFTAARGGGWVVLLVLLARPSVERTLVRWDKPVLAVLLDQSKSMAIRDVPAGQERAPAPDDQPVADRAARANAAIAAADDAISRLGELYEVRLWNVGTRSEPASNWAITPNAPLTNLSGALRAAQEPRSASGQPPPFALLISDGAENVSDRAAVWQAADDLAAQKTALIALGVGPAAAQAALVELDPLVLPPRVGPRDLLRVAVAGRVRGCRGQTLELEVLWDNDPLDSIQRMIAREIERVELGFDVLPPGPGVHRVTVTAGLPEALGEQVVSVSRLVEVVAGRVRVLCLEQGPRTESAFVARALRADPGIEFTQRFLFDGAPGPGRSPELTDLWTGFDVILLGRLRSDLPPDALDALADAVTLRGAGLLLCGGGDLLWSRDVEASPLAALSPALYRRAARQATRLAPFVPTEAGLRHPVMEGAGAAEGGVELPLAAERAAWSRLPPANIVVEAAEMKPAALVLAEDDSNVPLLAAQEVGRGRCLAAAWESTWHWALASDEGSAIHRRLWRQMVAWLANRRARAWVVTDQPSYALAALEGGERRVRIRAGVSGPRAASSTSAARHMEARLTLRRAEGPPASTQPSSAATGPETRVNLERDGDVWVAELPDARHSGIMLAAGRYLLEFEARGPDEDQSTPAAEGASELSARTSFVVVAEDLERRAPTADLALLRGAAARTRDHGGRYKDVDELPELLRELTHRDSRQRVETLARYEIVDRNRWALLLALSALLGIEWAARKRIGLP